ncbi:hypothetical protein P152DRAFT_413629 [Eremomyces bilateralis CBS 781.70]|uniref:Mannan polymerase II complex ANP1 subunit n=1 Tax=Eremomyces bilateralis CBS 781.70 TaxID=1392243 RepID=A0A6G1G949_9PEZI|nr:uncharacterized protein P152DRAFT_413629 [Eremomyces bilateralis CBS 781.70]KAF1814608.1 hypothetical protein P152DRAFT_413629 [Eremomyces bilateralis CBS 781.70]
MLLPTHGGTGGTWKAAKSQLLPTRAIWSCFSRSRILGSVLGGVVIFLLWRFFGGPSKDMSRFYCSGPSKPPTEMTAQEQARWASHINTPVLFNYHKPITVNSTTIEPVDLNPVTSTPQAVSKGERVLILTPLRDAARFLPRYFDLLSVLTYPHHLADLAFLVGDCTDDTMGVLAAELDRIQSSPQEGIPFRSVSIVQKDFGGPRLSQAVDDRHAFEIQAPRRKAMARARNYLLSASLRPDHSWVYWRDVDIYDISPTIIEDLVSHDKDIVVPNVWFHRYEEVNGKLTDIEGRFDYNSWQESAKGLKLAAGLDKDVVIAEGYKEFSTGRTHMTKMGDWRDPDRHKEIPLDGIGGVSIVVKADVHRSGINFPCYAFENQAETEGFAKMAKRAGYSVVGLPNYIVWHIDTDEKPGNA